jgi:D-3-phosphoglycerate dehydrogenase
MIVKSNKMKVLFIDQVHEYLEKTLVNKGFSCFHDYFSSKEEIQEIAKDYGGLVIRSRIPIDKEFLEANAHLKFIARSGSGMENIDTATAKKLGIECFSSPFGNKNAVAEHALGMLLALFNNLLIADLEIRNGVWQREANRGIEIMGKTIALIGYGNNGSAFAEKLRAFGCKILAYDKYKTGFGNDFVTEANMETIFEQADIVSFHIPQNSETINLCNDTYISSFKKDIYVINTSRGKIVNTQSLVNALEKGKVKGACLDVLEYEKSSFENVFNGDTPPAMHYLLKSNRVILSPHVAGWTKESYLRLSESLANQILRFTENEK